MHCSDEEPTLDSVHELILGASRALVLKTALELDVFTLISRGNRRLADIANSAGFEQKGLRTMLDALCPMGFLAKTSGEYVLTPVSEKFLVRDAETYYGHTYGDEGNSRRIEPRKGHHDAKRRMAMESLGACS